MIAGRNSKRLSRILRCQVLQPITFWTFPIAKPITQVNIA
jgi:hypothetical protein